MAAILKRVSPQAERAVFTLAEREGRTFVAQLDRVVNAGLEAMGEDTLDTPDLQPANP